MGLVYRPLFRLPLRTLNRYTIILLYWFHSNVTRLAPVAKLAPFYLDFKNADFDEISRTLVSIDWESELDLSNPNAAAETFSHILSYVIDRHVPKHTTEKNIRTPWFTTELRRLKKAKRCALRSFNKSRSSYTKDIYRRLNSVYKKVSKRCHQNYLARVQRDLKSRPKSFWKRVKSQRNEPGLPNQMFLDDNKANSDRGICDLFDEKFSSIYNTASTSPEHLDSAVRNIAPLGFSINNIVVEDAVISKAAAKLKNSFSTGPDGIPATFIKRFMPVLLTSVK
ncbi:uncharacterized protein LOC129743249 [Uranotaenia lowii]|uniref:uncharacterized protein LOC129743249 n=1 Tax=Uranotaenia lowii TaxID=190385 RepID=UPI00247AB636|nr:uncharacterized protein LOC129743249 [Uranotaenia lowii]